MKKSNNIRNEIRELNNKDNFTKAILELQRPLYAIAKARLKDEDDICDAIQETMLEAYKNIGSLRKQESFRSWITKILINKCNDIYRKNSKYTLLENDIYNNIIDNKNQIKEFNNDIDFEILINGLSYEEKLIIISYYYNQYTTREISYMLNINESTIRSKIKRSKAKLKAKYKEENCNE